MIDYYAQFSRLPKLLAENAWRLDSTSVLRSRACLFPTKWAACSAIRDYGADPSRVHAIPWGANIHAQEAPRMLVLFRPMCVTSSLLASNGTERVGRSPSPPQCGWQLLDDQLNSTSLERSQTFRTRQNQLSFMAS